PTPIPPDFTPSPCGDCQGNSLNPPPVPPIPGRHPKKTRHHDPFPRRQYKYCGPGTGSGDAFNKIDEKCEDHDLCYEEAGISAASVLRHLDPVQAAAKANCDAKLCNELNGLTLTSWKER